MLSVVRTIRNRVTTAALVIAVLAIVPAASANGPPAVGSGGPAASRAFHAFLRVGTTQQRDRLQSCRAHLSRVRIPGPAAVGQIERKVAPVACEQPPRSQLPILSRLGHAEANAITALVLG